jgi:hypothetical protein
MTKKRAKARTKTAASAKRPTSRRKPSPVRKTNPSTGAQASQPPKSVVVTLLDSHLPSIDAVAAKLRAKGMKVESVLGAIGLITGSLSKSLSTLEHVEGVSTVEEQPSIQIPPPESDIQ